MQIRVLFFGPLVDRLGLREDNLQLHDSATARDVYEHYGRKTDLGELGRHLLLAINQEFCSPETRLHDRDEVAFLPPMSGGSQAAAVGTNVIVEITREPIDSELLRSRLRSGSAGAVVTFDGTVRNHTGHRQTRYLEYEAYEAMALKEMRAICAEVQRRWNVDGVGIVHRLGEMQIGESSVVIVVAAEHRRAAFEACAFAIDTLKKTVPIWKKEFFVDGSEWVEGQLPNSVSSDNRQ